MPKITTFLTYDDQAEEAAKFYVSVFKNSRIGNVTRYGEAGPGPKGSVMTVTFELDGQEFVALNGGPHFKFTDGISLSTARRKRKSTRTGRSSPKAVRKDRADGSRTSSASRGR